MFYFASKVGGQDGYRSNFGCSGWRGVSCGVGAAYSLRVESSVRSKPGGAAVNALGGPIHFEGVAAVEAASFGLTPERGRKVHKVKSWTYLFRAVLAGGKHHDIRVLDRDYQVGDYLWLREYDWGAKFYTGRNYWVEISYITSARASADPSKEAACAFSPVALHPDYGVLSIERVHPSLTVKDLAIMQGAGNCDPNQYRLTRGSVTGLIAFTRW